jgi:hypothetical protein
MAFGGGHLAMFAARSTGLRPDCQASGSDAHVELTAGPGVCGVFWISRKNITQSAARSSSPALDPIILMTSLLAVGGANAHPVLPAYKTEAASTTAAKQQKERAECINRRTLFKKLS